MHSRVLRLETDSSGGSAVETIGVSPARYAGAFFRFNPTTMTPTIHITNEGRDIYAQQVTTHKHWDELAPGSEKLIAGNVEVDVQDGVGGTVEIAVFLRYD